MKTVEQSFTCPVCRRTSHNSDDVKNRYCGHCHDFFCAPGQPCMYCGEEITPADNPARHGLAMHYECSIRSIVGSLAHLEMRCSCYGGSDHDDPTLTARQNAKIVCQTWHQMRASQ